MPKAPAKAKFKAELTSDPPGSGWHFIVVESKMGERFPKDGGSRRVICSINGHEGFQCALMPSGGAFYIMVSKEKRARFDIAAGDTIAVELRQDTSEFGAPMPEELEEVMNQDPEGRRMFDALTAGGKRSMLYFIGKIKDVDRRIHTALIFMEHLKKNEGKLNRLELSKDLKRPIV
ncbi:MAG: DUF1905 domain-containing protein [Acidobacteria bacterium]|nr:DUF1905 domain-containing protein [Acidobacteriota bacterium]